MTVRTKPILLAIRGHIKARSRRPARHPLTKTSLPRHLGHCTAEEARLASIAPGAAPKFAARVYCADEKQTKSTSGLIDKGLGTLAQQLSDWEKQSEGQPSPERAERNRKLALAVDQLRTTKTTVSGNTVEISLGEKELAAVGGGLAPLLVEARKQATSMTSMNNMKQLGLGLIMYADAHNGQWPNQFQDMKDFVGGEEGLKTILANRVTGEAVGYIYQKPENKLADLKAPSSTALIYEATGGRRNESGFVGYADGHVARAK